MQFGLYTIQLPKKDVLALVSVIGSSQYFPVLDCVSYSWTRKTSCLSLRLGLAVSIVQFGLYIVQTARRTSWLSLGLGLAISIFSLGLYTIQLRKRGVLDLARVSVSSQYLPVMDWVSYSWARKASCLSLWLGLAVSFFQFIIVYRTVRKKDFVALAMVRVSSQYFQFGIVYHTVSQEWCPGSR